MLQKERHDRMLVKLNLEGSIRVRDIAKEYNVTEDCIRKDLTILEREGKLKRIHGGATSIRENPHIFYVSERISKFKEEKKFIAQKAVELIQPGSVVFLGITTTNIEIAKLIYEKNLNVTVVTNMIDVMQIFTKDTKVNLIFVGGTFNHIGDGFVGAMTMEYLKDFHFDIAFIGVVGVDIEQNKVTTYDINDGLTKKQAIRSSAKKYLVVESVKFNHDANCVCAKLEDFTGVITDKKFTDNQRNILEGYGLEII